MNFLTILCTFLAVCYSSAEVFIGSESFKNTGNIKETKTIFWPIGIPIPPVAPAITTTAPIAATTTVSPVLANCAASCCKRFCFPGGVCTAAVPPATVATCGATAPLPPTSSCINVEAQGCAATQCTPRANCATACGTVVTITPISIC